MAWSRFKMLSFLGVPMDGKAYVCLHIMSRANEFTRFVSNSWHAFEIALILFFTQSSHWNYAVNGHLNKPKGTRGKKTERVASATAKWYFQFNQQWHKREKKWAWHAKKCCGENPPKWNHWRQQFCSTILYITYIYLLHALCIFVFEWIELFVCD